MLLEAGVKTNIHYVLHNESINEAVHRLKENTFPRGINTIVFLLHKPIGLGTSDKVIRYGNKKFQEFIEYISKEKFAYKIGFDSCSVPILVKRSGCFDLNSLDTCEGARWSAYISSDMKMLPCSFDNQQQRWAVDLRKYSIKDAWEIETFENFRTYFKKSCPNCFVRTHCIGGCPICPEIVLCNEKNEI